MPKLYRSGILVTVLIIGSLVFSKPWEQRPQESSIRIGNSTIEVETVNTRESRERGLSGRPNLEPNHGMLFVYEQPSLSCFWMKNMRFNIDILWFSEHRRLVHVEQNVSPSSYPNNYCTPNPAKYVLEVSAGTSIQIGAYQNQTFEFVNQ